MLGLLVYSSFIHHPLIDLLEAFSLLVAGRFLVSIIEPIFYVDSISSLPSIDYDCLDRSVHTCFLLA